MMVRCQLTLSLDKEYLLLEPSLAFFDLRIFDRIQGIQI